MRVLVVGGTRFVGRHLVEAALSAGHEVTIFHRGRTGSELFPDVEHRLGDRNTDLSALADGEWDATIDTCAYVPRHVTSLADALGTRGGQQVLISSVSAYAQPKEANYREDAPLLELDDPTVETVTNETYGGLKVLCERSALAIHGDRALVVRPTYVIGPHDYSWRFPTWVRRIAAGGEVLAPGPASDYSQYIDARDMAGWIVSMLERDLGGVFHTVAPSAHFTWGEELETIASAVAPADTTLTWVDEGFLAGEDVDGTMFPLWSGGDDARLLMSADPTAAFEAGLQPRSLHDTVVDTLAWIDEQPSPPSAALTAQRESELLGRWKSAARE
jgi:2'-hydroxyisoflavone reductase